MRKSISNTGMGSKVFDFINITFLAVFTLSIIYPLYYCFIYSFSDGYEVLLKPVYFLPVGLTFDNYRVLFSDSNVIRAFLISASRTVIHTSISVILMSAMAYGLSKRRLKFRKIYMTMGLITMYFGGGLIPTFILFKQLRLIDSYMVYVFPGLISFFYVLIFISFFAELPDSIEESAKIDGANDISIFLRIIPPMSLPPIATIVLFVGVANWNDFFTGVIYITRRMDLLPIQTFLYRIIVQQDQSMFAMGLSIARQNMKTTARTVQYATMFITTLPIVFIYPFLQRYLIKGMMIGAVKG